MIAAVVLVFFKIMGIGLVLGKFGEPVKGTYGWREIIATIVTFVLYYYAGIFDKILGG